MLDLPPLDPGIEMIIATRGMSKGIAQTEGPQLIAKPYVQLGKMQVGGQWKNVTSATAGGEAALFANIAPKVGQFQLQVGVAYKFQTGVQGPTDNKSWEFTGSVSRTFGRANLRMAATYSPDDLGGAKQSLFLEGGASLELGKKTRVSGAVGHRDRADGANYTAWNAGVAATIFNGVTLDVRYYATDRGEIGEFFDDRIVAQARIAL